MFTVIIRRVNLTVVDNADMTAPSSVVADMNHHTWGCSGDRENPSHIHTPVLGLPTCYRVTPNAIETIRVYCSTFRPRVLEFHRLLPRVRVSSFHRFNRG
jgi:hypothetical protein